MNNNTITPEAQNPFLFHVVGIQKDDNKKRAAMDYYATNPQAVKMLLQTIEVRGRIWEPAAGGLHLSNMMKEMGYDVYSTDIIDRGGLDKEYDFLSLENSSKTDMNIITTPPYKMSMDFIKKGLQILSDEKILALFFPIRYLEGKERRSIYALHPPKDIIILGSRIQCARNGDFDNYAAPLIAYCWIVWKGGWKGDTRLRWIK